MNGERIFRSENIAKIWSFKRDLNLPCQLNFWIHLSRRQVEFYGRKARFKAFLLAQKHNSDYIALFLFEKDGVRSTDRKTRSDGTELPVPISLLNE
ncbi:hypothetical protein BWI96_20150 [Siphonobacter sp. SORGH_AS_0500]|uniref:hypothetical protein n=1 Tax=Siphonobacter sp. SORGH_AS_0500 TaxID=1864824 RepID=UPI000CB91CA9|nr:hypothetical protein [Siphonobacter sp. SORGH_AS_0500]PKK34839.1 hypothetical protein BWI96_20150 [Siphonobacter sp. SORGH_AS_0500]